MRYSSRRLIEAVGHGKCHGLLSLWLLAACVGCSQSSVTPRDNPSSSPASPRPSQSAGFGKCFNGGDFNLSTGRCHGGSGPNVIPGTSPEPDGYYSADQYTPDDIHAAFANHIEALKREGASAMCWDGEPSYVYRPDKACVEDLGVFWWTGVVGRAAGPGTSAPDYALLPPERKP
jgi:hypothetical protein